MGRRTRYPHDYIVTCYRGHEEEHPRRRVFSWRSAGGRHEGYVDDFVLHLEEKLGTSLPPTAIHRVHEILRKAGYRIFEAPHGTPRRAATSRRVEDRARWSAAVLRRVANELLDMAARLNAEAVRLGGPEREAEP